MPKHNGICPRNIEVDLYSGCSFGCVYCIAKSRHSQESAPVNDINVIMEDVAHAGASSFPYYLSPWTDAYQPAEADTLLTRDILRTLAANHVPFFIITKSSLVLRDIEFLMDSEDVFVAVSLNTLDDDILKRLEPNAPGAEERQNVICELLSTGRIKTVVKIDPVIPGITDDGRLDELTSWLCDIKPYAVTIESMRLTEAITEDLQDVLSDSEYNAMMDFYPPMNEEPTHPMLDYRLELFGRIADTFKKNGIRSSFCRASLPYAITQYDCRGGY